MDNKKTENQVSSDILTQTAAHAQRTEILMKVKEIHETKDIKELAQLLSSGHWIAICATPKEPYTFSLGRIE